MSIFGSLMNKIRGHAARQQEAKTNAAVAANAPATSTPPMTLGERATLEDVEIDSVLEGLAAENKQTLDWRNSIVDLMKLVGMDSSLANRKELAAELGYTGSTEDSAAMNVWLHEQVKNKLAENGGKVPASMLD